MPMGWSWAPHVCTDPLGHAVRITGAGRDLARERCAAPLITVAAPVCSVYVDNINVHGISCESCDRRHEVIIAALETRGFSLHDLSSINSRVSTSTGSLVFYVMILAAFGGFIELFVVFYDWVEHDLGSTGSDGSFDSYLFVSATLVIGTPSTESISSSSA